MAVRHKCIAQAGLRRPNDHTRHGAVSPAGERPPLNPRDAIPDPQGSDRAPGEPATRLLDSSCVSFAPRRGAPSSPPLHPRRRRRHTQRAFGDVNTRHTPRCVAAGCISARLSATPAALDGSSLVTSYHRSTTEERGERTTKGFTTEYRPGPEPRARYRRARANASASGRVLDFVRRGAVRPGVAFLSVLFGFPPRPLGSSSVVPINCVLFLGSDATVLPASSQQAKPASRVMPASTRRPLLAAGLLLALLAALAATTAAAAALTLDDDEDEVQVRLADVVDLVGLVIRRVIDPCFVS